MGGTGRQYLGTLICEGGLPLRVVQSEGARLRRYFGDLLCEHETYPTLDPMELAARLGPRLPARMQYFVVYDLAAKLIRLVAEMRRQGATAEDAALWPVPLRLDAEVAREFLEGLRTAPRARESRERGIAVRTVLHLGPELLLQREVALPPKISLIWLQEKFAAAHGPLPTRLDLCLQIADGSRVGVGIASLQGEGYLIRQLARRLTRPEVVAGQTVCIASFAGRDLGSFVPVGATALTSTPWIFSDDGTEGTLLSGESFRTRAGSVLLAVPASGEFAVDGTVEELGAIMGHGRRVLRLRGEFLWSDGDDEILVATGQTEDCDGEFELRGPRAPALVREADLWLGLPELWHMPVEGGAARRVSRTDLAWRSAMVGSSWRKAEGIAAGVGQLAFRRDDGGFRALVRLLPADFRVTLRCGANGTGIVELRSAEMRTAGVLPMVGLTVETRSVDGGFDVHLCADPGNVPACIVVQLRFPDGTDLPVTLPFPSQLAAFVGRDGRALERGARVSVDELAQIRAVVVSPEPVKWSVDVLAGRRTVHMAYLRYVAANVQELHLEPLRHPLGTELASTADLDDDVELRLVQEGGAPGREPKLRVRRYDLALQPRTSGNDHRVEVVPGDAERLSPETLASLRAESVSLEAPELPPVVLQRLEAGVWSTDNANLMPGPWLILVKQGDYLKGRPFRITIPGHRSTQHRSALERAIAISKQEERRFQVTQILQTMAKDPASTERDVVQSQLSMLGCCPAATFDVVRAVASNPCVAVQCFLEAGPRQAALWNGLEELPFNWACVPMRLWLDVVRQRVEYIRSILPSASLVTMTLEHSAPGLFGPIKLARFLNCVHDAAYLTVKGIPEPRESLVFAMSQSRDEVPPPFLLAFDEEQRALLQRHADDILWPPASPFEDAAVEGCRARLGTLASRLQIGPGVGYRQHVLMAPLVLALHAVDDCAPVNLLSLRQIRAFDLEWFEFAHAFALSVLLGHRFARKDSPFDD